MLCRPFLEALCPMAEVIPFQTPRALSSAGTNSSRFKQSTHKTFRKLVAFWAETACSGMDVDAPGRAGDRRPRPRPTGPTTWFCSLNHTASAVRGLAACPEGPKAVWQVAWGSSQGNRFCLRRGRGGGCVLKGRCFCPWGSRCQQRPWLLLRSRAAKAGNLAVSSRILSIGQFSNSP